LHIVSSTKRIYYELDELTRIIHAGIVN